MLISLFGCFEIIVFFSIVVVILSLSNFSIDNILLFVHCLFLILVNGFYFFLVKNYSFIYLLLNIMKQI